jgi:ABC-type transporter Mla subunit MlaD
LFVLVALFVLGVGIFYVTGPGFLGPKYELRTYFPEVAGVTNGAPVRLDGVDIGNVEAIRMVPRVQGKAPTRAATLKW